MSQVMLISIVVVLYLVYLVAGMHYQFPIAWLDWNNPFMHYEIAAKGSYQPFVAPILVLLYLGYLWYQKSMVGEA